MADQNFQIALDTTIRTEVDGLDPKSIVISSQSDRDKISETVKGVRFIKSRVINFFKDMKENAHKTWKGIVSLEKSYTDKCDEFEKSANNAILVYDNAQERERQRLQVIENERVAKEKKKLADDAEAARKLAEDAEDSSPAPERAELLREAERKEAEAALIKPSTVAPMVTKQTGESIRTVWRARVVDVLLVPRAYLMVNEKALDSYAKDTQGKNPIPGVEFYTEQIIVRRNT